jgi:hypothetical protein
VTVDVSGQLIEDKEAEMRIAMARQWDWEVILNDYPETYFVEQILPQK